VIQQLDRLLERYGGVGAIARKNQLSNWFVMNEIEQLATMSKILPTIFLVVAAFLTNIVLARADSRYKRRLRFTGQAT
jgi:putative ABC transport system permease protein